MNKFRKFVNTTGFTHDLLYVLYDVENNKVINMTANGVLEEYTDDSVYVLKLAEKFCLLGRWEEVSCE